MSGNPWTLFIAYSVVNGLLYHTGAVAGEGCHFAFSSEALTAGRLECAQASKAAPSPMHTAWNAKAPQRSLTPVNPSFREKTPPTMATAHIMPMSRSRPPLTRRSVFFIANLRASHSFHRCPGLSSQGLEAQPYGQHGKHSVEEIPRQHLGV